MWRGTKVPGAGVMPQSSAGVSDCSQCRKSSGREWNALILPAGTFSRWLELPLEYAAPRPNWALRSIRMTRVCGGLRCSRWSASRVPLKPAPTIAIRALTGPEGLEAGKAPEMVPGAAISFMRDRISSEDAASPRTSPLRGHAEPGDPVGPEASSLRAQGSLLKQIRAVRPVAVSQPATPGSLSGAR